MASTQSIDMMTTKVLMQIRGQLDEALSLAKAAEACAAGGHADRALRIALDIEPLAVDVNHLLQGIAVLNRLSRRGDDTDAL